MLSALPGQGTDLAHDIRAFSARLRLWAVNGDALSGAAASAAHSAASSVLLLRDAPWVEVSGALTSAAPSRKVAAGALPTVALSALFSALLARTRSGGPPQEVLLGTAMRVSGALAEASPSIIVREFAPALHALAHVGGGGGTAAAHSLQHSDQLAQQLTACVLEHLSALDAERRDEDALREVRAQAQRALDDAAMQAARTADMAAVAAELLHVLTGAAHTRLAVVQPFEEVASSIPPQRSRCTKQAPTRRARALLPSRPLPSSQSTAPPLPTKTSSSLRA